MTDSTIDQAGMPSSPGFFELLFSPSGAAVFVAGVLLVAFLVIAFYPPLRDRIFGAKWKAKVGTSEIEHEPVELSRPISFEAEKFSSAKAISEPESKNEIEHSETVGDEDLPDAGDETHPRQLFVSMIINAHEGDEKGLKEVYERYLELPHKDRSEEELTSFYEFLRAENNLGNGLEALQELEKNNETWTVPSFQLARLYLSLDAYDKATEHVQVGLERAQSVQRQVPLELTRADILIRQDRGGDCLGRLYSVLGSGPIKGIPL